MDITFLVGNGFDIKQGLATSYKDFYRWLQSRADAPGDRAAWTRFKHKIDPDHRLWADLETALGKYLAEVATDDEARQIIDRLRDELQQYIGLQDKAYDPGANIINPADLYHPVSFFPEGTQQRIIARKGNIEDSYVDVNVILFNYTTSFERLLQWKGEPQQFEKRKTASVGDTIKRISNLEHIHGFCDDRGRLAVGVDNPSQIANDTLAKSAKVCRRYVKHEFNNCYELDHPQLCAQWINRADIICIYGMSLGESDQRWWDCVANRLDTSSKPLLFYFVHRDLELRGNNGPEYQDQVDEDRQYVMDRLGLTDHPSAQSIASRIFISYSPAIFAPDLPF